MGPAAIEDDATRGLYLLRTHDIIGTVVDYGHLRRELQLK